MLLLTSSFVTVTLHAGLYYHLFSLGLSCLFLRSAVRAARSGRTRDRLISGVLLSAVALSSGYCLLVSLAIFPVLTLADPRRRSGKVRSLAVGWAATLAVAFCLAWYPYSLMFEGKGQEVLSEAASFTRFTATTQSLLKKPLPDVSGVAHEDGQYMVNYLGTFPLLLALVGIVFAPARLRLAAPLAAAAILFLLAAAASQLGQALGGR